MELRYQIPTHLEGFIGNIPEPQLNALITMLFEYAIQHRMIDYPRTEIENSVDEIRRTVGELKSKQSLENSLILQMMSNMNAQIATIHMMMVGGQMPQIPQGAQVASFPYMPMFAAPQQVAPSAQDQHQFITPPLVQPQASEDNSIVITEEELIREEGAGSELGNSGDETQDAFEADMFK